MKKEKVEGLEELLTRIEPNAPNCIVKPNILKQSPSQHIISLCTKFLKLKNQIQQKEITSFEAGIQMQVLKHQAKSCCPNLFKEINTFIKDNFQ